jgi:CBS domain-containing protein
MEVLSPTSQYFGKQTIEQIEHYYIDQKPNPVISATSDQTVEEVLKLLRETEIHSVPIRDPKQKITSNGTPFLGMANTVDLLTAFAFQPVFNTYDTDKKIGELREDTLKQLNKEQQRVLKSPIAECMGISLESQRLQGFSEKDPVYKIIDSFSVGNHRALIFHQKDPQWSFLSQIDVLRYLKDQSYSADSMLHDLFKMPLYSLKLVRANQKMTMINSRRSAISGFRHMMLHKELSALPVVDEEGKLMETLSTSDFHFITLENFKDVLLPVKDYLEKRRGEFKQTLITVFPDQRLFNVVDAILMTGVHRVWVVDKAHKPVGVISLTDIMKTFSHYAPTFVEK